MVGSALLGVVPGESQPVCIVPFGDFAIASEGFSSGLTTFPSGLSGSDSPRLPWTN